MTISEYSRRMNRVLDHIDRHLDQPLDLDQLATVANFSPFHFHRVFTSWLGETTGDYLQRRRLTVGASRLSTLPDMSVLAVALSVGFGSGEAFARAFKRRFHCTPTAWRAETPQRWAEELAEARARNAVQQRNLDQEVSNIDQVVQGESGNDAYVEQAPERRRMNVRFIELPATRVAYLRKIGPYGPSVGIFWGEVFHPWRVANGLDGQPCYGMAHDDPSITAPEQCRCDCCVEVPDSFVATGQAMVTTLPGGRYAAAQFQGTSAMLINAWTEMFRDWLPSSGMRCDARPFFEYYGKDARFDPSTGVFDCELCIPVCPL